ncbi:MAG: TatD family hydrolase [Anaerolineae bacterium]|nr:MAG: TatD family hydrolase [Anaerolineae bacterium]
MLIDTHAHLDFRQFDDDRDAVLDRAWEAGLAAIVTIGIDLETSRAAVALAETHERVFATVGFHPHDAKYADTSALAELSELAQHPRVVAIGEIGLDYYRDRSPREVQRRLFRQQLQMAAQVGKPVVIHDREAHADTLKILRQWVTENQPRPAEYRGVLHCFSGDLALAQTGNELGFFIGVDGPITYRNARHLPALVKALPLDRLLLETDAPFLTPHPYRGQRNEPAYVRLVVKKIAEVKKESLREIAQATTTNANTLFRLGIDERKSPLERMRS